MSDIKQDNQLPIPATQIQEPSFMDIINSQSSIDRVKALVKLLELNQIDLDIVGEKHHIINQELLTEYSNPKTVQWMVKNETWRKSVQEVTHAKSIDDADRLVGFMDAQVILKMISFKRKREVGYINGLKGNDANQELVPQNTKRKRFFGMM